MTTATLTRSSTHRSNELDIENGSDNDVDAVFAELAARALNDEGAANQLRLLLLPSCRRIAGHLGDNVVAEVADVAYAEVMDWAASEAQA
jgi:hypothetical protein